MEKYKCPNTQNNPKCSVFKNYKTSKECKSCSRYGKNSAIKGKKFPGKNKGKNTKPFGAEHPMHGKSWFDVWVEKYGIEKATEMKLNKYDRMKGEKNPMYGKCITPEQQEKRKKSWKENAEKNRASHKKAMQKLWASPENRKKQSERISKIIAAGEFNPWGNHKRGKYKTKFGTEEYYASSYELARMIQLDSLNTRFTKSHHICIPYKNSKGEGHLYIPDLLVEDKIIEEIKPSSLLSWSDNKNKVNAADEYCKNNSYNYRIITEMDLGLYLDAAIEYHEKEKNI